MPDFVSRSRDSVLFITLDSCRYDTFRDAAAPNMKAVGPLHRAQAPNYNTYGSHSSMFVGFTPGLAHVNVPVLNPKFGRLFKLTKGGFPGKGESAYQLDGSNIAEGFKNLGYRTIGSGTGGWFHPERVGRHLTDSFDVFFCPDEPHLLEQQVGWLSERLAETSGEVFAFLNVGVTHVPYYYNGAPWEKSDNTCLPFQTVDRSADCRQRQRMCCEFADRQVAPLIRAFMGSTVILCSDHGDCWGEDGLWEHGISHPCTLTVPLLVRVRGVPVELPAETARVADDQNGTKAKISGFFGRVRRLAAAGS